MIRASDRSHWLRLKNLGRHGERKLIPFNYEDVLTLVHGEG